jgi:hypothetical protein
VEQTAAQPKSPTPTPEQIRRRAQEIFEARRARNWMTGFKPKPNSSRSSEREGILPSERASE